MKVSMLLLMLCSLTDEYPTLTEMLLPWIDIVEYQGTRMLAEQHCISPLIMDSLALAHGQLSYIMSGFTGDASDRVITQHFRRRPGLALRKSMERNGFARVPDSILLCNGGFLLVRSSGISPPAVDFMRMVCVKEGTILTYACNMQCLGWSTRIKDW
jgi:hypothetical protein